MTRAVERSSAPRWLLPADDELIRAIGRAVYSFAQLERSVERAREALGEPPGRRPDDRVAGEAVLLRIVAQYSDLKDRRDALFRPRPHGPADGVAPAAACAWRTEDILRMARDFEAAAIEANRALRKRL